MPPAVALLNYHYEKMCTFADFFPNWKFSRGFLYRSLISEAAMDGAGVAQCPYLRVREPKKMGVRSARAHKRDKNPLVLVLNILVSGY